MSRRMALREITPPQQTAATGQSSQVVYEKSNLLERIPPATQEPEGERLHNTKSLIHVVFDIETTNEYMYETDIIQLSAACGENEFNSYIIPQRPIRFRPEGRHFSMSEGKLCFDGKPVNAESSAKEALQKFVRWLQKLNNRLVLVAHNGKIFDCPRLILHLQEHDLLEDFKANVVGFIDTLILFKNHFSMDNKPSLKSLVEKKIPQYEYERDHDALEDVRALKELLDKTSTNIEDNQFKDASFSLAYAIAYVEYARERSENMKTLNPLCISENMKKKIAGSGLRYCDLEHAYQWEGQNGIEKVLSQMINGKPRVTKRLQIISMVHSHFKGLEAL
ncbi:uncharacterized protein LOC116306871 [Actinia tenebrosa]|uniref:Uncharacterized protein LOC116306871 n=1 Tax=Actinia tenebrosa TaxID=6105 RepID=A0A6P8J6A4_ACTTE|nr:uncharacterized protein LOC116306871 [Actinia tenebrosa]